MDLFKKFSNLSNTYAEDLEDVTYSQISAEDGASPPKLRRSNSSALSSIGGSMKLNDVHHSLSFPLSFSLSLSLSLPHQRLFR